jgi:putative salt-induced outer membrane protein YdiY
MKKPIATILAAVGVLAAFAETSTNTSAPGVVLAKKYPWQSSLTAGLTLTKGNSDTLLFTASLQTQKKMPHDEYKFGAEGSYGENNSVENNKTAHAFGQYNHLFNERLFGYLRADGLHDGIADLDYRVSLSPGLGYYLLKSTNTTLAVEAGPGVVFERLGSQDDTYATLRLAERFEHKFTSGARVWQSVEFSPELDKWEKFVANAELGVEAPLTKQLSLRAYVQDTYVNEPAAGRKNNDLKLISGVAYKF